MTLRMVVQPGKGEDVLALHGWLCGPEVAEFERVAGLTARPLRIDLSNLAGVDDAGIAALTTLRRDGVRLTSPSRYSGLLLEDPEPPAERPARRARRGSRGGDG